MGSCVLTLTLPHDAPLGRGKHTSGAAFESLHAVVIGGLALSAVLTLGLIPPLLSMLMAPVEARRHALRTGANLAPAE